MVIGEASVTGHDARMRSAECGVRNLRLSIPLGIADCEGNDASGIGQNSLRIDSFVGVALGLSAKEAQSASFPIRIRTISSITPEVSNSICTSIDMFRRCRDSRATDEDVNTLLASQRTLVKRVH